MKLTDIFEEINWVQIKGQSASSDNRVFDDAVQSLKGWSVTLEEFLDNCVSICDEMDMTVERVAANLMLFGASEAGEAVGHADSFDVSMRQSILMFWIDSLFDVPLDRVDWKSAVEQMPGTNSKAYDFVKVYTDKWKYTIEGHTSSWDRRVEQLSSVEPTKPERVGLILLTELLLGKETIKAELKRDGINPPEDVLESSHGMQMGSVLMWARNWFNRSLETSDKTGI